MCSFRSVPKDTQIHYLRDGSLHIAFGREILDEPGIAARTVISEDLYLAYRPDNHRIDPTELEPADLKGLPLVVYPDQHGGFMDELFRRCRRAGFIPTVMAEAENVVAALAYVAIGAAVCVVPESATVVHARGVAFKRMGQLAPVAVTCLYPTYDRSPTLDLFVKFLDSRQPQAVAHAV